MSIFFTADLHLGHHNIISYADRPFIDLDAMHICIIENWNKVVGEKDDVYVLGDIALIYKNQEEILHLLKQLNGRLYLVKGNHDRNLLKGKWKEQFMTRFVWVKDYHHLKVYDEERGLRQKIILCHYPIASWDGMHHGSWHCHGHSHGTFPETNSLARMDVGIDCNNFTPLSCDQIKVKMLSKTFLPVDHHRRK